MATLHKRRSRISIFSFDESEIEIGVGAGRRFSRTSRTSRTSQLAPRPTVRKSLSMFSGASVDERSMGSFESLDNISAVSSGNRPLVGRINGTLELRNQDRRAKLRSISRALTSNQRFNALTAILTLYALLGQDFRMAATHKGTDVLFDIITVFCMVVFSLEVVVASLGLKEYFLGFYFFLDVVTTLTLCVDLTWLSNAIFCRTIDGETLKTSTAGRVGTRVSRAVRILRLVRMVKFYKAFGRAINADSAPGITPLGPGQEVLELFGERTREEEPQMGRTTSSYTNCTTASFLSPTSPEGGSRVGRKLTDRTTRRVIVLVLVMLLGLPQFSPAQHGVEDFQLSASLGLEMVYERLRSWCLLGSSGSELAGLPWCLRELDASAKELLAQQRLQRVGFEQSLLAFLYAHHSGNFMWRLCWVGLHSASLVKHARSAAPNTLGRLAQLNQGRFLGNDTVVALEHWDREYANADWREHVPSLPEAVKARLADQWQEQCSGFIGVNVQATTSVNARMAPSSSCSVDEELRCLEVAYFSPMAQSAAEAGHLDVAFAFDMRAMTQLEAWLGMLQTVFICLAVGLGVLSFSRHTREILLDPIERMMAKLAVLQVNPMAAVKLGDMDHHLAEKEQLRQRHQLEKMGTCSKSLHHCRSRWKPKEPVETVILERTIIQLGHLLALSFGEAGAAIVGQGLKACSDTADAGGTGERGIVLGAPFSGTAEGGTANAADPPELKTAWKVDAMMGFCRIHRFLEVVGVLQENITFFVNQVSEIVHGCVDDFQGAPIRNTGDAFLVIWRISGVPQERHVKLTEMAVMAFIRILTEIQRSRVLAQWREHPGLQKGRQPFRVELGVGLHRGWAIEGTIGSKCKIDATYLSPNVNIVTRLEGATEHYGVWIVVSEPVVDQCGKDLRSRCRLIDHVTIKGFRNSLRLYTVDLDIAKVRVRQRAPRLVREVKRSLFKVRQSREVQKREWWEEDHNVCQAFESDEDLVAMRSTYSAQFFRRFNTAFRNYEVGEWMASRDMLFTCHYVTKPNMGTSRVISESDWPADGPTVALLRFMSETAYLVPDGWLGHHRLP